MVARHAKKDKIITSHEHVKNQAAFLEQKAIEERVIRYAHLHRTANLKQITGNVGINQL